MKLTLATDKETDIVVEGAWFNGGIERDGEAIFSFNIGPASVEYSHYYNGYTNYMTWAVSLWLDNEEVTYRFVRTAAERIRDMYQENAVFELEKWLTEYVESRNPLAEASMFSDIMANALAWVNWAEIAENILEE